MVSGKRLRCRTPCMISNHSSGECVHQIDISVRCIGNMQKCGKLQIQFYSAAFVCISLSLSLAFDEQPAMPDKRVAWSRLLLGFFERRQKTGARLWLMSPSFLPNHRAPKSQFSGAWPPILTQPPLIWILSFDSIVIIDLPVSRATSPSVIVWDIEIHSRPTQAFIPSKKQWLKLPNKVERTRTALAITIWGQSPDQPGKKGGGWALCPNRERWHNTHQLKAMRFLTSLIVVLYATKRSFRDEFSKNVQPFILNHQD